MKRTLLLLPALMAWAALVPAAEPVAGRDYQVIDAPQSVADSSRVVVTEFFSYYCPHCAVFSRTFAAWTRTLPADVRVERVPTSLGHPQWEAVMRAYLVFAAMNVVEKTDDAMFQAIHQQGLRMESEQAITAWVGTRGVDPKAFTATYHSFGIDAQARAAEARVRSSRVDSIPMLMIDGRFLVAIEEIPARREQHFREQLATVDALIARARKLRSGKKP